MNGTYKGLKEVVAAVPSPSFIARVKENQRKLKQRLKEIDHKEVMCIEEKAARWGKTLVDKSLLEKLKDFNYWKEWKQI